MSITVVVGMYHEGEESDPDLEVYGPFANHDTADKWIRSIEHMFNVPGARVGNWFITNLDEPFQPDRSIQESCQHEHTSRSFAGAPGTGYVDRCNDCGEVVTNTIRELRPDEVI